jgi:hypothetical protein
LKCQNRHQQSAIERFTAAVNQTIARLRVLRARKRKESPNSTGQCAG